MIFDSVTMTGKLSITLIGEDGVVKEEIETCNLVVLTGKTFIASRMVGTSSAVMSAMAIGTGTTPSATGDITLQTEVARVSGASFASSTAANVTTYTATFVPGVGTGTISEAAIFNSTTTGGTLLARTVFAAIPKAAGETLIINWNITVS